MVFNYWLLLLGIMFSRFFCLVVCIDTSFLFITRWLYLSFMSQLSCPLFMTTQTSFNTLPLWNLLSGISHYLLVYLVTYLCIWLSCIKYLEQKLHEGRNFICFTQILGRNSTPTMINSHKLQGRAGVGSGGSWIQLWNLGHVEFEEPLIFPRKNYW